MVQVVAFLCRAVSLARACARVTVAGELPDGATQPIAGQLHDLGSPLIFLERPGRCARDHTAREPARVPARRAPLAVALFAITPLLIAVGVAWQALFLAEVRRSTEEHPA